MRINLDKENLFLVVLLLVVVIYGTWHLGRWYGVSEGIQAERNNKDNQASQLLMYCNPNR